MAKAKIRLISELTEEEWQRAKTKREAYSEQRRLEEENSKKEIKEWRKRNRQLEQARRILEEYEGYKQREYEGYYKRPWIESHEYPTRRSPGTNREIAAGRPMPEACEICGRIRRLVFDHCHKHGHFRGWICVPCNAALGMAQDDEDILRKLADYLKQDRIGRKED